MKDTHSHKHKIIFSVFISIMLTTMIMPIVAHAEDIIDYGNLPKDLYSHIIVATGSNKLLRSIGFAVLSFLAKAVSEFDNVLHEILSFNILDAVSQLGLGSLLGSQTVKMVFSIFLIVGAVSLLIFRSKIRLNDFFVGIITSLIMIWTVPILTGYMDSLREVGVKEIDKYSYSDMTIDGVSTKGNNGLYYSIGDEILSYSIIDVNTSGKSSTGNAPDGKRIYYYSESKDRAATTVFNLNYNKTLLNGDGWWNKKPIQDEPVGVKQKSAADLTMEEMMDMLGLKEDYIALRQAYLDGYADVVLTTTHASNIAEAMEAKYSKPDTMKYTDYYYMLFSKTQRALISAGANYFDVQLATASSGLYFEPLVKYFRNTLFADMLLEKNKFSVKVNNGYSDYTFSKLVDEEDFENMGDLESLGQRLSTLNEPVEYIYAYDCDFLPTFIILLAVLLSLIFACLKLGTIIFDLIFIQLMGTIFIASDQNNNGRAKKVFQEIISSYLVILICLLLIHIYLSLVMIIVRTPETSLHYITKIILIIAFAKGTIDGPDFVTRVLGKDAGVKSGAATVMAISSGFNMVSNAARTATGAARIVAKPATKAAGGIAGTASGSVTGAAVGSATEGQRAYNAMREHGHGRFTSGLAALGAGTVGAAGGAVGGAVGGAASGTFGSRQSGNAFQRGSRTAQRLGDPINIWHRNKDSDPSTTQAANQTADQSRTPTPSAQSNIDSQSTQPSAFSDNTQAAAPTESGTAQAPDSNTTIIAGEKGEKGDKGDKGDTGNRGAQGEQGKNADSTLSQGTASRADSPNPTQSASTAHTAQSQQPSSSDRNFKGTYADNQQHNEQQSAGNSYAEIQKSQEQSSAAVDRSKLDGGSNWAAAEAASEHSSKTNSAYQELPRGKRTGNAFARPAQALQTQQAAPVTQSTTPTANNPVERQNASQKRSEPPAPTSGKADEP